MTQNNTNISRKVALFLIIGGLLLSLSASGAYSQLDTDRSIDVSTTPDDNNAVIKMDVKNPIVVDTSNGGGPPGGGPPGGGPPGGGPPGGGPPGGEPPGQNKGGGNGYILVKVYNDYNSDMDVNLQLTGNTDQGVKLSGTENNILGPQESVEYRVKIKENQRPYDIEFKINAVNDNINSTIYREVGIAYQ